MTYRFPHTDHLSPSQVSEYLRCPACFKLNRIDRVPKPMSVALPIGGAVHKAAENFRRMMLTNDNSPAAITEWPEPFRTFEDMAAEHFDRSLTVDEETGGEIVLDLGHFDSIGKAKDETVRLTKFALPQIAKLDQERGLIRAELDLSDLPENPFPFPMHGRIDVLYGPEPDLVSAGADLKTSSKQAMPDFFTGLQLGIYREFLPVNWMVDVLAKTKLPSLETYHMSPDGHELVRGIVLDVAERICRGDFPPRPGWFCSFSHGGPSFSVAVSWPEAV